MTPPTFNRKYHLTTENALSKQHIKPERYTVDISALFAQYQPSLLDFLYGMTRDRELAADLVQETFLRAHTALEPLSSIAYPQAWLYRIATNLALNAGRRGRHFTWISLSHTEPHTNMGSSDTWVKPDISAEMAVQDIATTVAERDAIWEVLAALPTRWRAVLLLQTVGGFDTREIAQLLQLSEVNVRKILFRAKERFRALHTQLEATGDQ